MSRKKKNAKHGLEDNIQIQEIFFYTNLTIKVKERTTQNVSIKKCRTTITVQIGDVQLWVEHELNHNVVPMVLSTYAIENDSVQASACKVSYVLYLVISITVPATLRFLHL